MINHWHWWSICGHWQWVYVSVLRLLQPVNTWTFTRWTGKDRFTMWIQANLTRSKICTELNHQWLSAFANYVCCRLVNTPLPFRNNIGCQVSAFLNLFKAIWGGWSIFPFWATGTNHLKGIQGRKHVNNTFLVKMKFKFKTFSSFWFYLGQGWCARKNISWFKRLKRTWLDKFCFKKYKCLWWKKSTVLVQSDFKKHMCFFVLFFDQPAFFVLFLAFKCFFFTDYGNLSIKIVIFVHFLHFEMNTSELSSDNNSQNIRNLLLKPFVLPLKSKGKIPQKNNQKLKKDKQYYLKCFFEILQKFLHGISKSIFLCCFFG